MQVWYEWLHVRGCLAKAEGLHVAVPANCPGYHLVAVHLNIQIKSGHLPWAKKVETTKQISVQNLFNNFWTSEVYELIVPGLS